MADARSDDTSAVLGTPSRSLWRRKRTYIWTLAILGFLHGFLFAYGFEHPPSQAGIQLFIGFTLNVALLGWCYVDAEDRMFAISGVLRLPGFDGHGDGRKKGPSNDIE